MIDSQTRERTHYVPQEFLDELLARVDIVEIIGSRIKLRKTGSNYQALCPFHTEKTPSFTVSPSKQFYHCFGCNASGNAINFLMQRDHLQFLEAINTLASAVGLPVPSNKADPASKQKLELYELLDAVCNYYQKQLCKAPKAFTYLKDRGLSEKTIRLFRLGYASSSWDTLSTKSKNQQALLQTGMIITNKNKTYDRFRDRIMFPIQNERGQIIGFGGRNLDNSLPKYLNSPETLIYHKGLELYGLHQARQANSSLDHVLVVEGYLDVISLVEHGITNVVATLGTAITSQHLQKLLRYANRIIFCFDGDNAGRKAAWRALVNILPIIRDNSQIEFIFLAATEDPDSQVRKEGKDQFLARLAKTIPLADFFFEVVTADKNLQAIADRAAAGEKANELLEKMPNGIYKQLMLDKLASIIKIDKDRLSPDVSGRHLNSKTKPSAQNQLSFSQLAIAYLLNFPTLAQQVPLLELPNQNSPETQLLAELIAIFKNSPTLTMGALFEKWRENQPLLQILTELANREILIKNPATLQEEFDGLIFKIKSQNDDILIKQLLEKVSQQTITITEKYQLQNLLINAKMKQGERYEQSR